MIKKHNNKNNYFITKSGNLVRDFSFGVPIDVNNYAKDEYSLFLENELALLSYNLPKINSEKYNFKNAVIVSDGPDLKQNLELLRNINAIIIGVNGSLNHWDSSIKMDFYLINNPTSVSMGFSSKASYFPPCIASTRTFPEFVKRHKLKKGNVYLYCPSPFSEYNSNLHSCVAMDDYRNPVCGALSLCNFWGVENILLFSCQDYYKEERPVTLKTEDGNFIYPQQVVANEFVDAMGYWFKNKKYSECKLGEFGGGQVLSNFDKIKKEEVSSFFS
jgi:hypothetical protein